MRKDLMEILACPMCKSELTLTIDEEKDDEVIRGTLFCAKCNERYPIEDSIPNLLPPDLRRAASCPPAAGRPSCLPDQPSTPLSPGTWPRGLTKSRGRRALTSAKDSYSALNLPWPWWRCCWYC